MAGTDGSARSIPAPRPRADPGHEVAPMFLPMSSAPAGNTPAPDWKHERPGPAPSGLTTAAPIPSPGRAGACPAPSAGLPVALDGARGVGRGASLAVCSGSGCGKGQLITCNKFILVSRNKPLRTPHLLRNLGLRLRRPFPQGNFRFCCSPPIQRRSSEKKGARIAPAAFSTWGPIDSMGGKSPMSFV